MNKNIRAAADALCNSTTYQVIGAPPHHPLQTPRNNADRIVHGSLTENSKPSPIALGNGYSLAPSLPVSAVPNFAQVQQKDKEPSSRDFTMPLGVSCPSTSDIDIMDYPCPEHEFIPNLNSENVDTPVIPLYCGAEAQRPNIDSWLSSVLEADEDLLKPAADKERIGMGDEIMCDVPLSPTAVVPDPYKGPSGIPSSGISEEVHHSCAASSYKENIRPSKFTQSSSRAPSQNLYPSTPSGFRHLNLKSQIQSAPHKSQVIDPLTPGGHRNLPPGRKKARINASPAAKPAICCHAAGKDFTIHGAQLAEALAQLSPDVERHRKGRGPRRERCMSYWDEDILPLGSSSLTVDMETNNVAVRKGKNVLGDSQTKACLIS